VEDTPQEEGSCNEDEEEDGRETFAKLSVTPVIKRDTSVATVLSIHGIDPVINKTGPRDWVKDEK